MQYSSFGTVLEYEQTYGDFFGVFLYLFLAFLVSNSAILSSDSREYFVNFLSSALKKKQLVCSAAACKRGCDLIKANQKQRNK